MTLEIPDSGEVLKTRYIVRGLISDDYGRLLIVQRALEDKQGGKWCLPGGSVEGDEEFELALQREALEETMMTISTGPLFVRRQQKNSHIWDESTYICSIDETGEFTPNDEVINIAFIDADEVDRYEFAFGHEEIVNNYFIYSKVK